MPIITITGGIGCDVESIAEQVAGQMKLPLFNDKKLLEEAEKMGFSEKESLESLKEKSHRFQLLSNKPEMYLDMMEAVVFEAVRKGNGVIPGHAGQMLLRNLKGVLHVRLFASKETRIMNLCERQGLGLEAAKKIVHKSDNEKRGFMHSAFHAEWDDLSLYDIVINRERLDGKATVKLISDAAETDTIKAGMKNMEEYFEKMALEKIVESALLKIASSHRLIVEAVEKDVVKIMGLADSKEYKDQIIRIVENQPGVSRVISEIAVYPVAYD